MSSAAVGYTQTFGKDEPAGAYEDIDHATCFFIIGSNTYEGHPPIWERIMIRKKSNPKVKIIVTDGDEIELESRYGKITGMVEISEDESPGVLFASFFDSKFLINVVVSDLLDPFSKQPEYKITAVSIKKHQTTS